MRRVLAFDKGFICEGTAKPTATYVTAHPPRTAASTYANLRAIGLVESDKPPNEYEVEDVQNYIYSQLARKKDNERSDEAVLSLFSQCQKTLVDNAEEQATAGVTVVLVCDTGKIVVGASITRQDFRLQECPTSVLSTLAHGKTRTLEHNSTPYTCASAWWCSVIRLCCCVPHTVYCGCAFPAEGALKMNCTYKGRQIKYAGCSGCGCPANDLFLLEESLQSAGFQCDPLDQWYVPGNLAVPSTTVATCGIILEPECRGETPHSNS